MSLRPKVLARLYTAEGTSEGYWAKILGGSGLTYDSISAFVLENKLHCFGSLSASVAITWQCASLIEEGAIMVIAASIPFNSR